MIRIGLTPRLYQNPDYDEVREAWDIQWARLLKHAGALPILLSSAYDEADFKNLAMDAVIFTGGNDLSILNDNPLSKQRDRYEERLLKHCLKHDLPVIGICRGMQFIGYVFGNTLQEFEGHVGTRHEIQTKQIDARFPPIQAVNSYHNYGFQGLSSDWQVLATAPDGCIEAAKHREKKIYLQMWHPEREDPFDPQHLHILQHHWRS